MGRWSRPGLDHFLAIQTTPHSRARASSSLEFSKLSLYLCKTDSSKSWDVPQQQNHGVSQLKSTGPEQTPPRLPSQAGSPGSD